jgi:hypothetical protein
MTNIQPYEIVNNVMQGDIKPSKAYVILRALKSELDEAIKAVEAELVSEITYISDREDLIVDGFKITHMAGRKSYDYKGVSLWREADEERKRIERLIKIATNDGVSIVDQHTGEVIDPVEVKHGSGFIKMERAPKTLVEIIK